MRWAARASAWGAQQQQQRRPPQEPPGAQPADAQRRVRRAPAVAAEARHRPGGWARSTRASAAAWWLVEPCTASSSALRISCDAHTKQEEHLAGVNQDRRRMHGGLSARVRGRGEGARTTICGQKGHVAFVSTPSLCDTAFSARGRTKPFSQAVTSAVAGGTVHSTFRFFFDGAHPAPPTPPGIMSDAGLTTSHCEAGGFAVRGGKGRSARRKRSQCEAGELAVRSRRGRSARPKRSQCESEEVAVRGRGDAVRSRGGRTA